jgi:hypothetical protein
VRLAVLEIDDADEFAAAEHGDGKECFEAILGQFVEGLKTEILEGIAADGDGTFMLGHPSDNAATNLELGAIDDFRVRVLEARRTSSLSSRT